MFKKKVKLLGPGQSNPERVGKKIEYYAVSSLTLLNTEEEGKILRNGGFETILKGKNVSNKYYLLEVLSYLFPDCLHPILGSLFIYIFFFNI